MIFTRGLYQKIPSIFNLTPFGNSWSKFERFITHEIISLSNLLTFSGENARRLNLEQQTAVVNIVACSNGKLPYILDGPPGLFLVPLSLIERNRNASFSYPQGTGKTHVLVAAIEEIVRDERERNFVLVCSSSNAACDELLGRLLLVCGHEEKILRLYAVSHERKKVEHHHIKFSNWDEGMKQFIMPELKYLYRQRVLICTLAVAGNLVRANVNASFRPDHFSHVIIDEVACTHETLTLIPIAGRPHFHLLLIRFLFGFLLMIYFSTRNVIQDCAPFPTKSKVASFFREMRSN